MFPISIKKKRKQWQIVQRKGEGSLAPEAGVRRLRPFKRLHGCPVGPPPSKRRGLWGVSG